MKIEEEIYEIIRSLKKDPGVLSQGFTDRVMDRLPDKKFGLWSRLKFELFLPREFSFDPKRSFFNGAGVREISFYFLMAAVFHFLIALVVFFSAWLKLGCSGHFFFVQPGFLFLIAFIFLSCAYCFKNRIRIAEIFAKSWLLVYAFLLILQVSLVSLQGNSIVILSLAPYIIISTVMVLFLFSVVEHSRLYQGR